MPKRAAFAAGIAVAAVIAASLAVWLRDGSSSAYSAEGFDPTGRTRPSWADSDDPAAGASSLHIVERYYTWTETSPDNANGGWRVQERWAEYDGDGRPVRGASETRDVDGRPLRTTFADSTHALGRDWIAVADQPRPTGSSCDDGEPESWLRFLAPGRPEVPGMLASGYREVEPASLEDLAAAVRKSPAGIADEVELALHAEFEGFDDFVDQTFLKTRSYYLDGHGWVIAYRGATYTEGGRLVSERVELIESIEMDADVGGAIDAIGARLEHTCNAPTADDVAALIARLEACTAAGGVPGLEPTGPLIFIQYTNAPALTAAIDRADLDAYIQCAVQEEAASGLRPPYPWQGFEKLHWLAGEPAD